MRHRPRKSPWGQAFALSAAIFVVALLVRLLPIGLYVTPDEPIWIMRSVRFLDAVAEGDLDGVPQTGHPGLTTMALGALGVRLMEGVAPLRSAEHLAWIRKLAWLAPENAAAFPHLAFFLPSARVIMAMVTSLGIVAVYLLGRRRLGSSASRWAAIFLALDPFLAGHSGLLHTDALQATFSLLALVLVIPRRGTRAVGHSGNAFLREMGCLVLVALLLALTGLTKMLGLLVAPGVAAAMVLFGDGPIAQRLLRVLALALLTVVFLLALYPPAWSAPGLATAALMRAITYHEGIGLRDVFFFGAVRSDPGPAFYPIVLLFRLTPPVLIGIAAILGGRADVLGELRRQLRWIAVVAVIYLVGVSIPTKKFDRYILTTATMFVLMGAAAWSRTGASHRRAALALLGLPWAVVAITPLTYASPLLGGPWLADRAIPLGWGEASSLAARKLNQILDTPREASLLTRNVPAAASFFLGETRSWAESSVGCTDAILTAGLEVPDDYRLVDHVTLAGRGLGDIYLAIPSEELAVPVVSPGHLPHLSTWTPPADGSTAVLIAWLNRHLQPGDTFLHVRSPQCYPLADAQLASVLESAIAEGHLECETSAPLVGLPAARCRLAAEFGEPQPFAMRFDGSLDLVAAAWPPSVCAPDPLTVSFRWSPSMPAAELELYLALVTGSGIETVIWSEGGQRLISDQGWAAPNWPTGEIADAKGYVPLAADLPPGGYTLVASLSDSTGWLGAMDNSGAFAGTQVALGSVSVAAPPYAVTASDELDSRDAEWPGLRVTGVRLEQTTVWAGQSVDLALGIERGDGWPPSGVVWELSERGRRAYAGVLPWRPTAPDTWRLGHRFVLRFAPRLKPDLPAATYELRVWPASLDTAGAMSGLGQLPESTDYAIDVGLLQVQQRPRNYTLPDALDVETAVRLGAFAELIGASLPQQVANPGDDLDVSLYWRARGAAAGDYTVFVHLVDATDRLVAQSDGRPDSGRAPTTTWLDDEIITDHHVLSIPTEAQAGEHTIYVGMYDALRGPRQPVYRDGVRVPDNRAALITVEVKR